MSFFPPNPKDALTNPFWFDDSSKESNQGFNTTNAPQTSGLSSRQSSIPSERSAVHVRNLIRWFVPESGIVEMYINPRSITYNESKLIQSQRTKGGFALQYWGEDLLKIQILGTTGTSGIEGINVLRDVYRAEQVAFEPYALSMAAQLEDVDDNFLFSEKDFLGLAKKKLRVDPVDDKPTLASLAFTVEMYYSGWVFRGFFNDFSVTESAEKIGLFDYTINFTATQRRGWRSNFFGWHRSATNGPSNSDPEFGPPHSYKEIQSRYDIPVHRNRDQTYYFGVRNESDPYNTLL